ncbi:transposase family protein [Methylococcus sp. ANG]|jgi:hypothetical protein|uniref:helix-turn-helix domain-containing protein n=1 Tax=Methylococcus sp. ANG TaxID=3231903 RepID=UPI003458A51E
MIFEKFMEETSERTVRALIGMSKAQFAKLCPIFEEAHAEIQQERVQQGEIKRVPKGGHVGYLDRIDKKLFFILHYLKTYCTFDVLGFHFGFSSGHAHRHVAQLLPVLRRSLAKLDLLPERELTTPGEMMKLIEKHGDIIIDGVECSCVRPQDDDQQKAHYSGKKNAIRLKP